MSLSFSIQGKLSDERAKQLGQVDLSVVNKLIARSEQQLVTKHLFAYSAANPNKMGGKRTNFVGEMARSVNSVSDAKSATVSIAHIGARLRIMGGTIKPVKAKYLTIPAIVEAYGKRARDFPNLELAYTKRNGKVEANALVYTRSTPVGKGAPKRGTFNTSFGKMPKAHKEKAIAKNSRMVVFWLVRSANIPKNRDLIPTDQQFIETALRTIDKYLDLKFKGGTV
jgi:hypothetical protein